MTFDNGRRFPLLRHSNPGLVGCLPRRRKRDRRTDNNGEASEVFLTHARPWRTS
jgi:hypothetical protein